MLCFQILGDKDDDDDDDADEKPSNMTGGESGRHESQEQNEVDHGDFEMVVSFATTMSPAVGRLEVLIWQWLDCDMYVSKLTFTESIQKKNVRKVIGQ